MAPAPIRIAGPTVAMSLLGARGVGDPSGHDGGLRDALRRSGVPVGPPHRPFALVLGGGGARGFAHLGVLRGLEHLGYRPGAIVGVSMGAIVGAAYALRADWYAAVRGITWTDFAAAQAVRSTGALGRFGSAFRAIRTAAMMVWDWGPGAGMHEAGRAELGSLLGQRRLEQARIPVAVSATDLRSAQRVVLRTGSAEDAVYASAALAGFLPPLAFGDWLLADGAYSDLAPIDVARAFGLSAVIAVDAGKLDRADSIHNGYQALIRAMEICHRHHAHLRFTAADLTLQPRFDRYVDTLEFSAFRECVAAGIRVVRTDRRAIGELLDT